MKAESIEGSCKNQHEIQSRSEQGDTAVSGLIVLHLYTALLPFATIACQPLSYLLAPP